MSPPLPTELLQDILAHAVEGAEPADRQATRFAFGQVCKSWHRSVEWWNEFEVIGPEQLFGLVVKLVTQITPVGVSPAGDRVRKLYIEQTGDPGARVVSRTQGDLDRLLLLTTNVEVLHLTLDMQAIVAPQVVDVIQNPADDSSHATDWLGYAVGPALSGLTKVTHFTLESSNQSFGRLSMSCMWLRE